MVAHRLKSAPMRAVGFTDPSFAQLADLAHLLAGLVFPLNRQPSAEAGMRRAMATLRISDPAELLRAAQMPGPMRDAILAELTVGESYFFRDEAQLALLASEIIPNRIATHGPNRPLRVWSAGCASGEEPYTVAILLRELGWPHPAHILGTDVAVPRLTAARRGRYTRWALRGVSAERVQGWFRRSGTYFDLNEGVRRAVEFRDMNLVHDDFATGGAGYDLVLCRNVMIYFDLDTVAQIAERLLASLDDEGWLVLGASDPPLAQLVSCDAVMTPAGMAYRRTSAARALPGFERAVAPAPSAREWNADVQPMPAIPFRTAPAALVIEEPVHIAVPSAARLDDIRAVYHGADYVATEALAIAALAAESISNTLDIWILYIRAVANQGRLSDAGELCARAIESHALSAELHYLHAMLLAESGWHTDAAIAARRSLFLDRAFVMSHMLLGDALTRTGDLVGARRAFENALHLIANDSTDAVAGADGVAAQRLRQVADLRLRGLPRRARA